MPIFEPWDIVKISFPYTDRPVRQRRPALVIAAGDLQTAHGLLWLAMITSTAHRGWPGDVAISDLAGAGLPAPSIVRPAKIATIDARDTERLGTLPSSNRSAVRAYCDSGSRISIDYAKGRYARHGTQCGFFPRPGIPSLVQVRSARNPGAAICRWFSLLPIATIRHDRSRPEARAFFRRPL